MLDSVRQSLEPQNASALFRPAGATTWWLLAGDSPSLGSGKRGANCADVRSSEHVTFGHGAQVVA